MGTAKQLLPLAGKPVIRHCLDSVLATGICDIIAVLGFQGEDIAQVLHDLPVRIVFNRLQKSEMADSVRTGLSAAAPSSTGIIIYPSDYPLVKSETVATLVNEHERFPGRIIIPLHNEQRGHPALFPRDLINEIFEGITLRDIINRDARRIRFVSVPDSGVLFDIDTEEDYAKIVRAVNLAGGRLP